MTTLKPCPESNVSDAIRARFKRLLVTAATAVEMNLYMTAMYGADWRAEARTNASIQRDIESWKEESSP